MRFCGQSSWMVFFEPVGATYWALVSQPWVVQMITTAVFCTQCITTVSCCLSRALSGNHAGSLLSHSQASFLMSLFCTCQDPVHNLILQLSVRLSFLNIASCFFVPNCLGDFTALQILQLTPFSWVFFVSQGFSSHWLYFLMSVASFIWWWYIYCWNHLPMALAPVTVHLRLHLLLWDILLTVFLADTIQMYFSVLLFHWWPWLTHS